LQFLSLHSVPFPSVSFLGFSPGALRHGSSRITLDVYAQAVTPAKRKAQGKVVAMLRDTTKEEKSG
jgi:hypothetical protein